MDKLCLQDLIVKEKKILVRVDFNVPLDSSGAITDDARIRAALPTIEWILQHDGIPILMSHLGRPKGKQQPKLSLQPCAKHLAFLLGKKVFLAPGCIDHETAYLAENLKPGEILLLENLRFHEAEEKPEKDPSFAKKLAALADCYVNDAFGTAHRNHSSITAITHYFPQQSAAGLLMEQEILFLRKAFASPKHPFVAIIGGAKISTKLGVLHSLIQKVDKLLIGGGMAYTFFKVLGYKIGDSIWEKDSLKAAEALMGLCEKKGIVCQLPIDVVIADCFSNEADYKIALAKEGIPKGYQGLDAGPKTVASFLEHLQDAKMVFWNGPVGVAEFVNFSKGTQAIATALAKSSAMTIVGGGDSIAVINEMGISDKFSHVSTGGGAALELIEKAEIAGVKCLTNNTRLKIT